MWYPWMSFEIYAIFSLHFVTKTPPFLYNPTSSPTHPELHGHDLAHRWKPHATA